jgi:hypothetical protein
MHFQSPRRVRLLHPSRPAQPFVGLLVVGALALVALFAVGAWAPAAFDVVGHERFRA